MSRGLQTANEQPTSYVTTVIVGDNEAMVGAWTVRHMCHLGVQLLEAAMMKATCLVVLTALSAPPQISSAAQNLTDLCIDISVPRQEVIARHGKWIELTPDQWQFLRGIYAMNPETPPGLPFGDKAVLAQIDGRPAGLVFFVDGDKACTPMLAPPELLVLMQEVATGAINHQGAGL
jgi:hypothetical protein